jgi:hypothetical protein
MRPFATRLLLVTILLSSAFAGASKPASEPTSPVPRGWTVHPFEEGGIQVALPAAPDVTKRSMSGVENTLWSVLWKDVVLLVVVHEHPRGSFDKRWKTHETYIDQLRDQIVGNYEDPDAAARFYNAAQDGRRRRDTGDDGEKLGVNVATDKNVDIAMPQGSTPPVTVRELEVVTQRGFTHNFYLFINGNRAIQVGTLIPNTATKKQRKQAKELLLLMAGSISFL